MLERERIIEIIVAVFSVAVMIGTMVHIGSTYSGTNNALSPEGGEMLVAAIVGFVFLLVAVGIVLAYVLNDPEDGLEDEPEAQSSI
ncbi:hypothetical protein [Halostagnicola sp. A-GB9-2]|uniref:DUF7472 family protein n=1 Tax=Halostagnicola sp. A-GB9-2 TaxID=3048066 RepID=UPI0024BF4333|nr:hypothetical protein [Halostagnicola sp. A-GB9-2]MDJ1432682.1 hypothetical protein [Halostagnicola sp. A-GB9-2]